MSSQDYYATRSLAKKTVIEQGVDDTVVGIRIRHKGTSVVSHVTISQAADTLELHDADAATTITFTDAATDTVGEVVDYINGLANWEAIVIDAKRDDTITTGDIFINGAITASTYDGTLYYDVCMDTSNYDKMAKRLIYSKHTPTGGAGDKMNNGHRVRLKEVSYNLTLGGGADTNGLKIYDVDGKTETEIWRSTPVTGTLTNLWSLYFLGGDDGITVKEGHDILVVISDATSVTGSMHLVGNLE